MKGNEPETAEEAMQLLLKAVKQAEKDFPSIHYYLFLGEPGGQLHDSSAINSESLMLLHDSVRQLTTNYLKELRANAEQSRRPQP